ncbi:hypothetical protein GGI43DRAFT_403745 [Trichoderma evansii]
MGVCVCAQNCTLLFQVLIILAIDDSRGSFSAAFGLTLGCFHVPKEKLQLHTELVYILRILFHSISIRRILDDAISTCHIGRAIGESLRSYSCL